MPGAGITAYDLGVLGGSSRASGSTRCRPCSVAPSTYGSRPHTLGFAHPVGLGVGSSVFEHMSPARSLLVKASRRTGMPLVNRKVEVDRIDEGWDDVPVPGPVKLLSVDDPTWLGRRKPSHVAPVHDRKRTLPPAVRAWLDAPLPSADGDDWDEAIRRAKGG